MRTFISCFAVVVLVSACSSHVKDIQEEPTKWETEESIADKPDGEPQTTVENTESEGIQRTVSQRYSGKATLSDVVVFSPTANVLWPGAVVNLADCERGHLNLVPLARSAGHVTFHRLPGQRHKSDQMDSPSAHAYSKIFTDVVQNIPSGLNRDIKSSLVFSLAQSQEQLCAELGIRAKWLTGEFKGFFRHDNTTESVSLFAHYTQSNFDATFEPINNSFFASSVSSDDMGNAVEDKRNLAYISTVSYGCKLFIKLTFSYSSRRTKLAAKLKWNAIAADGGVIGKLQQLSTGASLNVQIIALGGSGFPIVEAVKKLVPSTATTRSLDGSGLGDKQDRWDAVSIDAPSVDLSGAVALLEGVDAYQKETKQFDPDAPGIPVSYALTTVGSRKLAHFAQPFDYKRVQSFEVAPYVLKCKIEKLVVGDTLWEGRFCASFLAEDQVSCWSCSRQEKYALNHRKAFRQDGRRFMSTRDLNDELEVRSFKKATIVEVRFMAEYNWGHASNMFQDARATFHVDFTNTSDVGRREVQAIDYVVENGDVVKLSKPNVLYFRLEPASE